MSVIIVAHKFTHQPDDDLRDYLVRRKHSDVIHICHSFSDTPNRITTFTWYKNGRLYKRLASPDFQGLPELLIHLKELVLTISWLIIYAVPPGDYIGMDGLCVLFGLLARVLGRVHRVYFWVIDFVPFNRFTSIIKDKLYRMVNRLAVRHCTQVWDLSPRMAEAREKFRGIPPSAYHRRIVPFGVWLDRITPVSYHKCDSHALVFMGHLLPKQGVQLIIQALPELAKFDPLIKLRIIGAGFYQPELRRLAKKLHVSDRCIFYGSIPNHRDLEKIVADSCVALAPYIASLDTWTYYADPGKVKVYLGCGVPVLLTNLPWNAQSIKAAGCGLIISESQSDIIKKIKLLMKPQTNAQYRIRARRFARQFNYADIFSQLNLGT